MEAPEDEGCEYDTSYALDKQIYEYWHFFENGGRTEAGNLQHRQLPTLLSSHSYPRLDGLDAAHLARSSSGRY